jgi:ATP synthase protein I
MSQDLQMPDTHRKSVPRSRAADPAARNAKRAYNALNASSVGLELGLSVAIGLLVGYYMDKWLGTQPWLMLLWLTFGLVAGFRGVFRAVARADRAAEEQAKEDANGGS